MAELDDSERLLARYRGARRAPPQLQAVVRARLARALAEEQTTPLRAPLPTGRVLVVAAAVLAAAAAIVLVWQSIGDTTTLARGDAHEQADYERAADATRGDARAVTLVPAELPAALPTSVPERAPLPSAPVMRPRVTTDAVPRATPPTSALAAELAGLEAIRTQLAGGDSKGALAAISRHRAAFPMGQLGREREALTIEALCTARDLAAAGRRAKAFVLAHPDSTALAKLPQSCR